MDILGLIKDRLTDSVIEKVSSFLGEQPEKINLALNNAVPTVLGGIIQNITSEDESAKLMDVLKDGGHTGEILDDLQNILGEFDKTQLLITIGTNIYNHFLGNKGNIVVEKISSLNGIRKTSASSLMGLAAPLVLGALGKVVEKEGMGVSGLSKLLQEQRANVMGALPPILANKLTAKNGDLNIKFNQEKPKETPKEEVKEKRSSSWIPWVLLSFLLLAVVTYWWKSRKPSAPIEMVGVLPKTDSLAVTAPDTTFAAIPAADSTKLDSTSLEFAKAETATPPTEEVKPEVKPQEKKIESAKIETAKIEPPKVEEKPKSTTDNSFSTPSAGSVTDQLKSSTSWIALPNVDFRKGSAEIRSKGETDELVKFLKSNSKARIMIAGGAQSTGNMLAEDRSYAIREALLERGVRESQVEVQSRAVKDIDAKITVKVVKK